MYLKAREVELRVRLIANQFKDEEEKVKFVIDFITETSEQVLHHYSDSEDPAVQKVLGDLRNVIDGFKKLKGKLKMEKKVEYTAVENMNCIGCKKNGSDVMISVKPREDDGSIDIHDFFLSNEKAERLADQIQKVLVQNGYK
jgi:tetrahydromethanopterin S-methyltransferase subunit G